MTPASEAPRFDILSQLDELRDAWEQHYPDRAEGGLLALSGFEHQFLLTLRKIVHLWKESSEADRHNVRTAQKILTEAVSDITESGIDITLTQVKRTLSESNLRNAMEELWEIFNLASEKTPELAKYLRFVVSGKFEDHENPEEIKRGWRTKSKGYPAHKLERFKERVRFELVPDLRAELATELQTLSRDEDTETTIARWLGYFLQLGSGFSSESVSALIWKELIHDAGLASLRTTLARLISQSDYWLSPIRCTLGENITLPRAKLSDLRESVNKQEITLLTGPSGSGKSALCKLGIQQYFRQEFDCFFLQASDVASFVESSDVTANRGMRRLDELLIARITQKPILVVVDDLSDADEQHFDAVLNLLQKTIAADSLADTRFILTAHTDAKHRICEKISARFGKNLSFGIVELLQLPIEELKSSQNLPRSIVGLIHRYQEFGPALNLKLLDYLVRGVQEKQVDVSGFRNDLDLLNWFWHDQVQDGYEISDSGQALIRIAGELANRFTTDLPRNFDKDRSVIEEKTLRTLVRRDCLRIEKTTQRLAVTHYFVGNCARFRYLQENHRDIECKDLVEWSKNPFWVQPIRWFTLQLALEPSESETWQEFLCEALEGGHQQLLDLLLDGVILSKQPSFVLQGCPDESLPFVIKRLITRLLAVATESYSFHAGGSPSPPLRTRIVIQEQITGIPKSDLWEPVWRWLLSQSPEMVIEESCIVFRAAEAWLSWSEDAEKFPLRSEVAEFTLNLAQKVLLPDPGLQARSVSGSELDELIELRLQGVLSPPEPTRRKNYYLGDFSSNAFACIVFALRIIPERSAWLLKALSGRLSIPATRLEPIQESVMSGTSVLESPHLRGPLGKVNHQFRKFMLSCSGLYLNAVVYTNYELGAELLLALTISPPSYRYEYDDVYVPSEKDWGTKGSDCIDVCTFKFLPLLSLLKADEALAIDIVATLSNVVTDYWHEHWWSKGRLEGGLKTDIDGITLIVENARKWLKGGRHALYWHRQYIFCPKILSCFLMTLENWLYSLPTRAKLEQSISIVLQRADTVAIIGVFISLVKCDPTLIKGCLLPLISSLQLLAWLEIEEIDRADEGESLSLDRMKVQGASSEKEAQELLDFHQLPHRKIPPLNLILSIWIEQNISSEVASKMLQDWDDYQIAQVPEESRYRALKIRTWFDHDNWQLEEDTHGNHYFRFVGTVPSDPEVDAKAEAALRQIQPFEIIMICRRILNGELEKTLELHQELTSFLIDEEKFKSLKERFEGQAFVNVVWAMITIILSPPLCTLDEEVETELRSIAEGLAAFPICLDHFSRCQVYDLHAEAFIAHVAPKLLRLNQAGSAFRVAAFRCFVGARDGSTCTFMRSWIKEYGLEHPLTQHLVHVAPFIARLISLTSALAYARCIQEATRPDGSYIVPRPEEVAYEVSKQEDPQIKEAWLNLQNNFAESGSQLISILDACQWVPEVLIQPIQQTPDWLQERLIRHPFDWDFLTAALIPVLTVKVENDAIKRLLSSLCEQVVYTLLHEREGVYKEYKAAQSKNRSSDVHKRLYQAQSQLLDVVIRSNHTNISVQINKILHALEEFNLTDCILLEHIIDTLGYGVTDSATTEASNDSLRSQIAFAIGDYLFRFRNQADSDLRILGKASDVWEDLIEFLSRESRVPENVACVDQSLVRFFGRFQEVLFPHWWLRRKLYRVAKLPGYKQFRRAIFKALIQHQNLLPGSRNEESEILVQVLAELWDSDYIWIAGRQSRLQDLRTLLGHLQAIDAVGARRLADQIANFLANPAG